MRSSFVPSPLAAPRWALLAAVCAVLLITVPAAACPTCKDTLASNGLAQGYAWSIIFMLSMPFLIFSGMCAYFYYLVKQAQAQAKRQGAAPYGDAASGEARPRAPGAARREYARV